MIRDDVSDVSRLVSDAGVEIDAVALGESNDGFLVGVGAACEEAGLGVARFHFAGVVHGVDVDNLDVVELFDSMLDLYLVGALVDNETVAVAGRSSGDTLIALDAGLYRSGSGFGEAGHLFANQRFYYYVHHLLY